MGFPFPRSIEAVDNRTRADDFTATLRPKNPFIRFSFYAPAIALYQTIFAKELIAAEAYMALKADDYVKSKLWPADPMKTKPCVLENGKPRFLDPGDEVAPTQVAEQRLKDLDQYCIRFFEYRRYALESGLSSGYVHRDWKKLARLMIKFNGYALDQVKSEGARMSLPRSS
jgi:hypothetical protein